MGDKSKSSWVDIVQTFWPILVFLLGVVWYVVSSQSVGHAAFNKLETRVTVVENKIPVIEKQMPTREIEAQIQVDIAVMKKELESINKQLNGFMEKLLQAIREKL